MDDFQILHEQITAWQERRFTVVTVAMTLVVVLCGFILSDAKRSWTREQAGTLIFMILFCATLFAWYAGWQNAIIGAFLRTARESTTGALGWETGVQMLNARGDLSAYVSLNKMIGVTFLVTAVGTNAIFLLHCPKDEAPSARYVHWIAGVMLAFALLIMSYPRIIHPSYDKVWKEIHDTALQSLPQKTITKP